MPQSVEYRILETVQAGTGKSSMARRSSRAASLTHTKMSAPKPLKQSARPKRSGDGNSPPQLAASRFLWRARFLF
jgi:hypothetical protein